MSSFANVVLSFPVLVLYVVIISTFGASGVNIVVAVTFASAPGIMRIVRGIVLDLRSRDYVASAQTRGESAGYIMFREILPNATSLLIVDACLRLGYTTITIGVLGFLGLGLPPPQPDWGGMINETRAMATFAPHMTVFPCIAISSFVLGLNLLADGLRESTLQGLNQDPVPRMVRVPEHHPKGKQRGRAKGQSTNHASPRREKPGVR